MTKEKYVKEVVKKLKCPKAKKKEIAKQLEADIQSALENGETMESILASMGTPENISAEFNENLSETEIAAVKRAKKWKIIISVLAVIGILAVIGVGIYWWLPKGKMINESETFQEEEVIKQAELIISLFDAEEYEGIINLSVDEAKNDKFMEALTGAKAQLSDDEWGTFQSFGTIYTAEVEQMGKNYVLVQMNAVYENTSVTYTITFDEELLMAGFYVR